MNRLLSVVSIQEPKAVGGCWLDIKKMRICTNDEDLYNLIDFS